jgi:hypothetical protein
MKPAQNAAGVKSTAELRNCGMRMRIDGSASKDGALRLEVKVQRTAERLRKECGIPLNPQSFPLNP